MTQNQTQVSASGPSGPLVKFLNQNICCNTEKNHLNHWRWLYLAAKTCHNVSMDFDLVRLLDSFLKLH